jgi:dipeptide/tripeptide permease
MNFLRLRASRRMRPGRFVQAFRDNLQKPGFVMSPTDDEVAAQFDDPIANPSPSAVVQSAAAVTPDGASIASVPTTHPTGFRFFFWGELAERCSYYGMRAILLNYMADELGFTEQTAKLANHSFIAACYFLPLVGGWVADKYLGKYWTIVGFSIPYILGHVVLGVESVPFLVAALALLAMGSGVVKPNISTLMGMTYDQQRPGQEKLRSDAFAMFYGAINIGAAASSFAMPEIRDRFGYRLAFLFPAALMVVAFFIFALGKRHYAVETISRRQKTPEERAAQRDVLAKISGIFALVSFVWSVQDQSTSTWTLFAKHYLDLNMLGYTLKSDQVQGFNPVLIVILLPLITLFWHYLAARGMKLRPTDKMLIGFVLVILTMIIMAAAGFLTSKEAKVSVLWEIAAYVVITTAEACISVVGLELAFTAAPAHMKSFVTACWLLTIFAGNLLAMPQSWLSDKMEEMSPGWYFSIEAVMMLFVTVAFTFVASRFNRRGARS